MQLIGMDDSGKVTDDVPDNSEADVFAVDIFVKDALKDLPEVSNFIQRLQECITRQRTLIHKLYEKLKQEASKKVTSKDSCTQTNEADFLNRCEESSGNLVEDIKKAAENAVQQTGFVYEATSGMYYDYKTGYYYDAELSLYYDGHNGIYYYFDESSKSFQFHSQISLRPTPLVKDYNEADTEESARKRKQDEDLPPAKVPKTTSDVSKEEGECTESSSDDENETIQETVVCKDDVPMHINETEIEDCNMIPNIVQNDIDCNEVANSWPPCLRIVVTETGLDNLVVGSLFIVTCTGGSLGRAGDHAILIPDINISKHHANISFSEEKQCYCIVDLGSRNGTFIDNQRISSALQESDPVPLPHGTVMRVGSTELMCHMHLGLETCSDCEPGCAQHKHAESMEQTAQGHVNKEGKHRLELKRLRKRFGLDKLTTKESSVSLAPGYQDRAEERRKKVGSLDHNAKTETASVHRSLERSNKGFQMLSKMGWAKGQSLGKDSTKGITDPVLVEQRPEKAGLGSDVLILPAPDLKAKKKAEIWKKAQQRFQELDDDD